MTELFERVSKVVPVTILSENEPASAHTTFAIGGPCTLWAAPESVEQIVKLVTFSIEEKIPYLILGKGSNVLFSDEGFDGLVIGIGKAFSKVEADGTRLIAQAGVTLSRLANIAWEQSLTGLEFASGIPGTLGGAIVMNAGAYGGEMKQVVEKVVLLSGSGEIMELSGKEMNFSYRHSRIKESGGIVLSVILSLNPGNREEIRNKMTELNQKRKEKQPLEYPSAGSTFKRPEGYFAGKLIEDSGLSGYQIGKAQVSPKHNGFVVNLGGATSEDVKKLIEEIQKRVYETSGVSLEREVIYLP